MQIQRYEVVYGNSESSFIAQINHMIEDGWQPLGGVSVSFAKNGQYEQPVYHQAMVTYGTRAINTPNTGTYNRNTPPTF